MKTFGIVCLVLSVLYTIGKLYFYATKEHCLYIPLDDVIWFATSICLIICGG